MDGKLLVPITGILKRKLIYEYVALKFLLDKLHYYYHRLLRRTLQL